MAIGRHSVQNNCIQHPKRKKKPSLPGPSPATILEAATVLKTGLDTKNWGECPVRFGRSTSTLVDVRRKRRVKNAYTLRVTRAIW